MHTKYLLKLAIYFENKIAQDQNQRKIKLLTGLQQKMFDAQKHYNGVSRGFDVLIKIATDYANGFWNSLSKEDQQILSNIPITSLSPLYYRMHEPKPVESIYKWYFTYTLSFGDNGASITNTAFKNKERVIDFNSPD
jgi:hypothetical protein